MKTAALPEKLIYEIWKNQDFKSEIYTREGEKIHVLDRRIDRSFVVLISKMPKFRSAV